MRFVLLLLLLLPAVSAEVEVFNLEELYHLGDTIDLSATVTNVENGVFQATLDCDAYELTFYSNVIEENGTIDLPPLTTVSPMTGECTVNFTLSQFDQTPIFNDTSKNFTISNDLGIITSFSASKGDPGDTITFSHDFSATYGEPVVDTVYYIEGEQVDVDDSFTIPLDAEPGILEFETRAIDEFGNIAVYIHEVGISQVPADIIINFTKTVLAPEQTAFFEVEVYDQSGNEIETNVTIETSSVMEIESFEEFEFRFPKYMKPGPSYITATVENLSTTLELTVKEFESFSFTVQNGTITVFNEGNTDLEDFTFLFSDGTEVKESQLVIPGTSETFEVEVPEGNYTVSVNGKGNEEITIIEERSNFWLYVFIIIFLGGLLSYWVTRPSPVVEKKGKSISDIYNIHADSSVVKPLIGRDSLEGEKIHTTVLLGDTNINTLTRTAKPWIVLNLLNIFFERFVKLFRTHHAVVNDSVRDEVLAFYNVKKSDHHILDAVKTAFGIHKEVDKMNTALKKNNISIVHGSFVIHTGEITMRKVENIEYLKSDLDIARKMKEQAGPNQILISEDALTFVSDHVVVKEIGTLTLENEQKIYAITSLK